VINEQLYVYGGNIHGEVYIYTVLNIKAAYDSDPQ
jgi:hypothetical protein